MDKEKEAIRKANERWVKSKPVQRTQKQKNRVSALLESQHLRESWVGRNYKATRG